MEPGQYKLYEVAKEGISGHLLGMNVKAISVRLGGEIWGFHRAVDCYVWVRLIGGGVRWGGVCLQ